MLFAHMDYVLMVVCVYVCVDGVRVCMYYVRLYCFACVLYSVVFHAFVSVCTCFVCVHVCMCWQNGMHVCMYLCLIV